MIIKKTRTVLPLFLTLAVATSAFAQELTIDKANAVQVEPDYCLFVDQHLPTRVFLATRICTQVTRPMPAPFCL